VDAEELEEGIKAYPLFYRMDTEYKIPPHFFANLNNEYIIHFEETAGKVKVISENETNYFYLDEVYKAEREIEGVIHQLLQNEHWQTSYPDLDEYINESCNKLVERIGDSFDAELFKEERLLLYKNIYRNSFFVLSGSPGSGKSYELLNIITEWHNRGERNLLLAPTGKAALRLKSDPDFKGIEAFTIDKILADIKNSKLSISALQNFNNIIIDEMSMVDLMKLRDLLSQFNFELPSFHRLVFVGDPNQLPAIGYGKVLKDISYFLKSSTNHTDKIIELQTNCRQELSESRILDLAEGYITDGEIDPGLVLLLSSGESQISKGFRVQHWTNEDELYSQMNYEFDLLCSDLKNPISGTIDERLNQMYGLGKDGEVPSNNSYNLDSFQLITPYRSEFFGSGQINDYIQKAYKPSYELELLDDWFKQSDKIIRTKNYYDRGKLTLSNGSIGLIRKDNETNFYFPELDQPLPVYGEKAIRKTELEEFDLAYAITVHKAQGSGFNHCFFILPKKPGLLFKELIYTALTRSRESVTLFVQGEKGEPFENSILEKARSRSYSESRRTTLLLDRPYRYYALEVDGIFISSRIELLIYQALKEAQKKFGEDQLKFLYEIRPTVGEAQLPMKTDFTLITKKGIWYWEHLGRLGIKRYDLNWKKVKRPTYETYGLLPRLITTDELNGINPDKISSIVEHILDGTVETEDKTNRYSQHHFSLR
jgi:hypothetical protein